MNPNLTIVREAVIKAVPEIMELKFGCFVEFTGKYMITAVKNDHTHDPHVDLVNEKGQIEELVTVDILEILGRKIGIADILVAIKKSPKCDTYWEYEAASNLTWGLNEWNLLSDSLEDQSPECLQFLAGLLAEK